MSLTSPAALILWLIILANLPWINERVFLIYSLNKPKPIIIRLVELIVYYFVGLLLANAFEIQFSGDVEVQEWEFYVSIFCLFVVLAVPGVVYRYQWLDSGK